MRFGIGTGMIAGDSFQFAETLSLSVRFSCSAVLSCPVQVVKASDVLFLFGGAAAVRDTLKSVKDDLKGHQIIVPVTKDGDIDNFQVLLPWVHAMPCLEEEPFACASHTCQLY